MAENNDNNRDMSGASDDSIGASELAHGYYEQAARALDRGDAELAMHLYLAAYEESAASDDEVSVGTGALRAAWRLACDLKERSIAEYVYDKLEPRVSQGESEEMSAALQDLALDHLSEFGISRADLEDMADMISDELASSVRGFTADVINLAPLHTNTEDSASDADASEDGRLDDEVTDAADDAVAESKDASDQGVAVQDASDQGTAEAQGAATDDAAMGAVTDAAKADAATDATTDDIADAARAQEAADAVQGASAAGASSQGATSTSLSAPKAAGVKKSSRAKKGAGVQKTTSSSKHADKGDASPSFGFADLVGFDSVIEDLRSLGIGLSSDSESFALIEKLRVAHGLEKLSAVGSIVLRTSSREDASQVMAAAAGELQLPTMRVQMQDGPQGVPVLYITSTADRQLRFGSSGHLAFPSPSVVLLEDVDLWGGPLMSAAAESDSDGIAYASAVRAARQATIFIRSVIENPDIYVIASVGGDADGQGYLYDLLAPVNVVDIYLPDAIDRRRIWNAIAHNHPSIRGLDLDELVRLSANLSRTDIVAAAHETIEEAYREGLRRHAYVPIAQEAVYAHLANYQPLTSDEYRQLEEAVLKQFHDSLDTFDDDVAAEADRQRARLASASNVDASGDAPSTSAFEPAATAAKASAAAVEPSATAEEPSDTAAKASVAAEPSTSDASADSTTTSALDATEDGEGKDTHEPGISS